MSRQTPRRTYILPQISHLLNNGGTKSSCRQCISAVSRPSSPDNDQQDSHNAVADCFLPEDFPDITNRDVTNGNDTGSPTSINNRDRKDLYFSHIAKITSKNLAGTVDGRTEGEITIHFGSGPNLVAVTGETGSGKSLLVSKVVDLIMGGKATPSMVPSPSKDPKIDTSPATVEMMMVLTDPHLSATKTLLEKIGIDSSVLHQYHEHGNGKVDSIGILSLKRILSLVDKKGSASKSTSSKRLKSRCEINGRVVTLKALRTITAPLLTVVDASAAASALAKPNSRMAIIDTAVSGHIKAKVLEKKALYRLARQQREELERELENQVLPSSFSQYEEDEEALAALRHWVDELDDFEAQIINFQASLSDVSDESIDKERYGRHDPFFETVRLFMELSWPEDLTSHEPHSKNPQAPSFYSSLLDLRESVKDLEAQILSAQSACEALSSLSSPDSAVTALERARNFLYESTGGNSDPTKENDVVLEAAEKTHQFLNVVEEALANCVQSIEGGNSGLLPKLEARRNIVAVSIESIDEVISRWDLLSRKHNISPFDLPTCHKSMRSELDGNVEARLLLPKARADEEKSLYEFYDACHELTVARQHVSAMLSKAVTQHLPALGMERSIFLAQLDGTVRSCTDLSAYGVGSGLGVDGVDFILLHDQTDSDMSDSRVMDKINGLGQQKSQRGGKLEIIGSSGEKARILLAIETILPGSVGESCGSSPIIEAGTSGPSASDVDDIIATRCAPAAVIYDEIDAHVGGRAAVALAKLLVDQTRWTSSNGEKRSSRGQVVSITHSPSVAAIADQHITIQTQRNGRAPPNDDADHRSLNSVIVSSVDGAARRKEVARMAAGDLAAEEAEAFADALIRDGSSC